MKRYTSASLALALAGIAGTLAVDDPSAPPRPRLPPPERDPEESKARLTKAEKKRLKRARTAMHLHQQRVEAEQRRRDSGLRDSENA